MSFRRRTLLIALLSLSLALPALSVQAARGGPRPIRVLFIGNSYTYYNNLPEIFAKLAQAGGAGLVETGMAAPGGWRLKDQWQKGEAIRLLHEGRWKFVVLQDQSLLGTNFYLEGKPRVGTDEVFWPFAQNWAMAIQDVGATPVFYLTWARRATPEDQAALNYAYVHAAKETGSRVAPVGTAWALVREQHPDIELYEKDGAHPTAAGSYLAACTLYATAFGMNPVGLPGKIGGHPVNLDTEKVETGKVQVLVDLPPDQAKILQTAAWAARQRLDKNGYLKVAPVRPPALPALPGGVELSASVLGGTWTGEIMFYPVGPVQMNLELRLDQGTWRGHLGLRYNSKDFADESFDLEDLEVAGKALTFSDPKSVGADNLKVSFRAVCPAPDEMRGTAEAVRPKPGERVVLLGTWQLRRAQPTTRAAVGRPIFPGSDIP
jgi:hypothetical protein